MKDRYPLWLRALIALLSGASLALAFPPHAWSAVAWVALVPLLLACRGLAVREAIAIGFISGAAFWMPALHWVTCVTGVGWIILSFYCSLYFIPTALFAARAAARGGDSLGARILWVFGIATVWTGSEYLRGILFTGFPWNALGVSQALSPAWIQHADWGGVYVISALVALANAAAASVLRKAALSLRGERMGWSGELSLALLLLLFAHVTGSARNLSRTSGQEAPSKWLRVSLVQPSVPQFEKWTPQFVTGMYRKLMSLTSAATYGGQTDMVVWPETAIPDDLRASEEAMVVLEHTDRHGAWLLAGALDSRRDGNGSPQFFNTSFLIRPDGGIAECYDKQHLVLFGEYVPAAKYIPWLKKLTPVEYLVDPGQRAVVFKLEPQHLLFSSLICFEDVFPDISRVFVKSGAQLLVNQTNDAWFDGSSGAAQHLYNAIFRCVETRTPMVRCANSGITCWIDEWGQLRDVLPARDAKEKPYSGFLRAVIPIRQYPETAYMRHGDIWGRSCLLMGALLTGAGCRRMKKISDEAA